VIGPKPVLLATAVEWMYFYLRSHSEARSPVPKRARVVGGGGRSARVALQVEMGPLRKSISVRLEEGVLKCGICERAVRSRSLREWLARS
jgi:hypothetical protein